LVFPWQPLTPPAHAPDDTKLKNNPDNSKPPTPNLNLVIAKNLSPHKEKTRKIKTNLAPQTYIRKKQLNPCMAEGVIDNGLQFWPRLGFSEMLKAERGSGTRQTGVAYLRPKSPIFYSVDGQTFFNAFCVKL
jgi:hypothetical protein